MTLRSIVRAGAAPAMGAALTLLATLAVACDPPAPAAPAKAPFDVVAEVLMHPRCVNCHPMGEVPLIGDHGAPHGMQVLRGPDGRGVTTTMCQNCHQAENLDGEHMPPGAPDWHMPTQAVPMVFEGRSAGALCRQLTDPTANGGKSPSDILTHLTEDGLVRWGFEPGEGRTPVPVPYDTFRAAARAWLEGGAHCPPSSR